MFRRYSINFALFSMAFDALLVGAALYIAAILRPFLGFLPFAANYPETIPLPWIIYPVAVFEWIGILTLCLVYDGRRNLYWRDEFASLTLGTLLAALALAGTLYLSFRDISRLLYIFFVFLIYLFVLFWRVVARSIHLLRRNHPEHQRKVLILGRGEISTELIKQIDANPQLEMQVMGILDDDIHHIESITPVLGPLVDLKDAIEQENPDDVVIALPQDAYTRIKSIIVELHQYPVKVWLIPDYFRLALHKAAVEEFAGIPMLDLRAPALTYSQRLIKRAFDLAITIMSLLFALPLMGIITLAIRLEGPGEIILKQERMGENGRIFKMYKFRTMVPGAEKLLESIEHFDEEGHLIHKTAGDPRVTRIGRILRRMSMDELPQFFNVLKGEMSLVGPRPELPLLVSQYETWQRKRFAIPQGMTGWWQINGRSDRPMHLHTEDDLYYIQHYSLYLDVFILLKTLAVVIQGKGAF
jgi:exopolysaccharide biosynthesis polyprenyl glycosylphosphotransferase